MLLVVDGIKCISVGTRSDAIIMVLFDGQNISFDASIVMYINRTNIPTMIMNRIYEDQNLLYIIPLIRHIIVVWITSIIPMASGSFM